MIHNPVENLTDVLEFHLVALSEDPDLQLFLFGLFLSVYLVTLLGNLLIILIIIFDSHLHIPMYYFLSNLSLVDIFLISTTIPKMIVGLKMHSRLISYAGCLTQMSLFLFFACMDDMILTVMAYDRFVAICHPLRYTVMMNPQVCAILILLCFSFSIFDSQLHNLIVLQITCFKDVEIANFFCHPSQLLNLACTNTLSSNIVICFISVILGIFPVLGIILSYCKIVFSILKIPSSSRKYKAFSTCGSHLTVVCLFYGAGIGVYLGSAVSHSPQKNAVASLMYTAVSPMLNPFIYTLRNRDISNALKRFHRRVF
ncbi:olfactory receptor Olr1171 [Rattus norvegicus]|uniref:Olfactory receptor family 7 subfamily E member 173 n=1 Tax=Rattus norvegicus TaxID=10116 RepID=M0RCF1_RAT|nr:olfactory receptor Olr1171 [Rattus norvegicus]|eukprot:NP_001001005.1 olfactory receptor Olr1171 [Rattus norvegicus]